MALDRLQVTPEERERLSTLPSDEVYNYIQVHQNVDIHQAAYRLMGESSRNAAAKQQSGCGAVLALVALIAYLLSRAR